MIGSPASPHSTPCCGIVPPYLLDALTRSTDRTVAGRAARTLLWDERMRRDRLSPGQSVRGTAGATKAPRHAAVTDGPQRSVHDAEQGSQLPGDLVRDEGAAEVADAAVNQAYDGLGDTWRLFHDVFGRNSLDGKGLPLIASVHYEHDYDNAFWNGEQMVFGDGDGRIFGPFTASIDVIGHELTHGVTEHTAGLRYQGQSGALNESISDVFGVLVKQYVLGQTADQADWLIGADLLLPSVNGVALRSMAAPGTAYDDPELGKDPQPATMADYVETSSDNGGVHINSGIPNKAFHLVATAIGGNAWEAPGSIWFEVLTGGPISADCDFVEFARLTEQATVQLYGDGSTQAVAVAAAWQQVGVTSSTPGDAAPRGHHPVGRWVECCAGRGGCHPHRWLRREIGVADGRSGRGPRSGDRGVARPAGCRPCRHRGAGGRHPVERATVPSGRLQLRDRGAGQRPGGLPGAPAVAGRAGLLAPHLPRVNRCRHRPAGGPGRGGGGACRTDCPRPAG
ncbi:MAG: M4 family metallopeptidase [Nakamurella sp.]